MKSKSVIRISSAPVRPNPYTLTQWQNKTSPLKAAPRMLPKNPSIKWITQKESFSKKWIHIGKKITRDTLYDASTQIICGEYCQ